MLQMCSAMDGSRDCRTEWSKIRENKYDITFTYTSVQSLSGVQLFETPWTTARQASLSITNSQSLLKLMSIQSVMPSNHRILSRSPLLLPLTFPSIRVFSNEQALCMRWPMYWSFSFSLSPSNEYSGLISFGMDWLDLLAAQGTLKSLLQAISWTPGVWEYPGTLGGRGLRRPSLGSVDLDLRISNPRSRNASWFLSIGL